MSRKAIYKDIANQLKELIRESGLVGGDQLPSEKQLASLYGINHVTVRRALEELRDQGIIHKIASKGNFVGKGVLKDSQRGLIGVLFPENEAFFFDILASLESNMALFGYSPVVHISRRSVEWEKRILEVFSKLQVDGIIAAPNEECASLYRQLSIPAAFFDTYIDGLQIPYVVTDDYKGSCDAVNHLTELGHRKIAYVGGKDDSTASLRLAGYCNTLKSHHIEINNQYILQNEYSQQWGYNAAMTLLGLEDPPTAVFCGNDTIAGGVMGYMSNNGISCPESLSIVGYGNLNFAEGLGLTTINQSCRDIANTAWSTMHSLLNQEQTIIRTVQPTSLIVRYSSASCK